MASKVAVIICAAGASTRFGEKRKKPFIDVAGRAAFVRSVEIFSEREDVKQIILSIPEEDEEIVKIKFGANLSFHGVKLCFGAAKRFQTVANALKLVNDDIDLIAVHDAVRCCVTKEWVEKVIAMAAKTGAAILACPVVATIKKVDGNIITDTFDRTGLYKAQTPQVFNAELLKRAYENLKNLDASKISDDAQLVEALGSDVSIVETDSSNIKITQKSDLTIAEAILKSRTKSAPKGYIGPYGNAPW